MRDEIVEQVVDKYYHRSQVGITKYGTTLEKNNRDDYFLHLQQELMDATLYLQKILQLKQDLTNLINKHPDDNDLGREIRKLIS